jgi:hypothetical protein
LLEVPVLVARDGPIAAIDPGVADPVAVTPETAVATAGSLTVPVPEAPAVAQSAQAGRVFGPEMPAERLAVRTVAPDAAAIEILAARPAWVRVTSADGTVLLEKTMDAGERFTLPKLEAPPILRAGNSGAVYFAVNGRTYGPAAPGARVVKNVELSPTALTAKFAFADVTKDPELAQMVAMVATPGTASVAVPE